MNSAQRVAETVWPWRTPTAATMHTPGAGPRRRRALLQCAITAAVATLLSLWLGRYRLGLFLYILGAVILVCGFLVPRAFDALERAGQKLAHAVALALTWVLLMPFFYLCFAPARLVLKLIGKDPMRRRLERDRASYWVDHQPPSAPQPYTRQY